MLKQKKLFQNLELDNKQQQNIYTFLLRWASVSIEGTGSKEKEKKKGKKKEKQVLCLLFPLFQATDASFNRQNGFYEAIHDYAGPSAGVNSELSHFHNAQDNCLTNPFPSMALIH